MMKIIRSILFIALLVGLSLGVYVYWQIRALSEQVVQVSEGAEEYQIPSGRAALHVLKDWQNRGWITPSPLYRWYFYLFPEQSKIKSGEYLISPNQKLSSLLMLMVKGDVRSFQFTIVEGWNIRDLRAALKNAERLKQLTPQLSHAELMQALGKPTLHPEGQFYPDTYRYTSSDSDLDLLKRASLRLDQQLAEAWEARALDLPYHQPYEALIMASIVEKETGIDAERADIAGVFVRRLNKGMRLQTDPTVIYGMGEAYRGNIRKVDLQTDTEYNTYTRGGLPPTPIAMAGRAAMNAALNPAQGESLYFVARGDGSHVFSVTLEQHNQAVADYLNTLRKRKR